MNLSQKNDSKQKKANRKASCDHLCLLVTKVINVLRSKKKAIAVGVEKGKVRESPTWTSVTFPASGQRSGGLGHSLTNVGGIPVTSAFLLVYYITLN